MNIVGGGIVFDSDPYDEYIETINKLKSNSTTLEKAEQRYSKMQSKRKTKDTVKDTHIDLAAG